MPTLNARVITRNDWDFKWKESQLVLQPGELAISIPTRTATEGDPVIPGTGEIGHGALTKDTSKDSIIKVGANDTFYENPNKDGEDPGRINGTSGTLVNLAEDGNFSETVNSPVKVQKNQQTGETEITVRQAKAEYDQNGNIISTQSGVVSEQDFKDTRTVNDFFRDSQGNVTAQSIQEKVTGDIRLDASLERNQNGELGVSNNIVWECGGIQ